MGCHVRYESDIRIATVLWVGSDDKLCFWRTRLQKHFRDERTAQQLLIDVETPLIRGAVPFKSSPWEVVEPEGR